MTVTVASDTGYTVSWSASSTNEEIGGGAPADLAGYRVYRSLTADTPYWQWVGNAAGTSFTDSNLSGNYRYRVTAYDNHSPWPNESYYSDSVAAPDTSGPGANVWYVNDNATINDTYCTAVGNDANHGLTPGKPKRTIAAAMTLASAGDTVYLDAGTYAEAVVVTADTLWLVGADSTSTIIDPGDSTTVTVKGIAATGRTDVTVRKLRVRNARYGIYWSNVDVGVIENVALSCNGAAGIYLTAGSDANRISGSLLDRSGVGVQLDVSSGNTMSGCVMNAGSNAVHVSGAAANNRILGNWCAQQTDYAIWLNNSNGGHVIAYNHITGAANSSMRADNDNANCVYANDLDSCGRIAAIAGTSNGNIVQKNNLRIRAAANTLYEGTGNNHDVRYCWWGTTDSTAIKAMIENTVRYTPYRLGPVDTAAGADTIAPVAPATVTVNYAGDTGYTITWSASTVNEEIGGAVADLAGYRVYRSLTADTSYWQWVGNAA
ncbi:MAG TPA: right-handed parallel beta-helix repeat-containing protein, partial [bacterium]|nr:right-handed parallel beta-helix repeat-containing protein [bacterium]